MTLKQIHSMFEVGQQWEAVNTYNPKSSGLRTVTQKFATQLVFKTPDVERSWCKLPKAANVIEARDGFLSFRIFSSEEEVKYRKPGSIDATLTLTRVAQ